MHVKKHLGFEGLMETVSRRFSQIADPRSRKGEYSIPDVLLSALAMMFFQDPSILQFQRRLEDGFQRNNLNTLFGVEKIPSDTHMRDIIDDCEPKGIEIVFSDFFRALQRGKQLDSFRVLGDRHLILLDGSEYFSSEKIHCPGCLRQKSKDGRVRYHHQILQAVLAKPGQRQVVPLAPEAIKNEDGQEKQDCEINAGKRLIERIRREHPKLNIVIGGDSLYSNPSSTGAIAQAGNYQ